MLRDAREPNGLHRAPRAGKQLAYQAAAAIAVSGHFVPVCGAKLGLHRNVKTAHDERHAGFEHDLRRVRVVVDVELCRRRHIAADGCAAHQGDGVQQSFQFRVFCKRDGHVCQRPGRDQTQFARHPLRRFIECVPRGRGFRRTVRQGQLDISEAVFAMELAGHVRFPHKGALRAGIDRIIGVQQMHDAPCVREGVVEGAVARHGGQRDDRKLRQRVGQHDCNGIVRAGVAVDPDWNLFGCHASASP